TTAKELDQDEEGETRTIGVARIARTITGEITVPIIRNPIGYVAAGFCELDEDQSAPVNKRFSLFRWAEGEGIILHGLTANIEKSIDRPENPFAGLFGGK